MLRRAYLLLLGALLLAGCTSLPDPAERMPALERRIAVLVEEEREKLDTHAKPLAIDPELGQVARKRSADMAAKNYLAHAAANGETAATLLMAQDKRFQGLLGENMAAVHFLKQSGVDVDAAARTVVDIWLNSPKHRDNMAFAPYTMTGIGAAANADTVYVTALFATDLGLPPHEEDKSPAQ
ncbi:MAG: CAP domain-containing protein [Alphaproteobacteria bacterium]|nr:CAP domain-containing protein [Alphaproteobacteria bacterium]